jgi:hypothetical protein
MDICRTLRLSSLRVATIPFDTWHSNAEAVRLIHRDGHNISLLIHGNNHTRKEFGRPGVYHARLGMIAQNLRRIRRLEACTGLKVDRVPLTAARSAVREHARHERQRHPDR